MVAGIGYEMDDLGIMCVIDRYNGSPCSSDRSPLASAVHRRWIPCRTQGTHTTRPVDHGLTNRH